METVALCWFGLVAVMFSLVSGKNLHAYWTWRRTVRGSRDALTGLAAKEAFDVVMKSLGTSVVQKSTVLIGATVSVLSWLALAVLVVNQ
jgi:hypothetical protein